MKTKICIFTSCTKNYLERAISLYISSIKYNPDLYFYIHLLNIDKDNYFEKLNNEKLTISYENIIVNNIRAYASCVRVKLFPKILLDYNYLFWMDADTIVRKNLDNLFNKLTQYEIIIYHKQNKHQVKIGEYKTGIIGVKRNKNIINFLNNWKDELFKNGDNSCKWFMDQLTITKVLKNSKLKKKNLELIYIDWTFQKNSYIWVGKGNRKELDIYLNEEKKYK
jgi:hypothetical protein